ncbi:MAG: Holliday junction resolvase RuvX [Bdellovibrionota bacterium]
MIRSMTNKLNDNQDNNNNKNNKSLTNEQSSSPSNILSLDVGEARIGLAIGYSETKNVFPLKTINKKEATLKIKNLIKEKNISFIVSGLPLNEDNKETTTSQKVRTFVKKLSEDNNNIPYVFIDEFFSSYEAKERLNIKTSDKKTRDSGVIDAMSAAIILERYFANENIIV